MSEILNQSANKNLRRGNPAWGKKSEGNGKSGNRNGRPIKDVSLTSLLKEQIDQVPPGEKQGRTWHQLLVLAWLTGAMKNPVLLKELLDRIEGKVSQGIDMSAHIQQQLLIEIRRVPDFKAIETPTKVGVELTASAAEQGIGNGSNSSSAD